MLTILRILFIVALAYGVKLYFGVVMPESVALIFGILIGGGLFLTMINGKFGLGALLSTGIALSVWPAGALLITYLSTAVGHPVNKDIAVALAPLFAVSSSMMSYSVSNQRDRVRDTSTIVIGMILVYTMLFSMYTGAWSVRAAACLSVVAGLFMSKQMAVVPPSQESYIAVLIQLSCASAAAAFLIALF